MMGPDLRWDGCTGAGSSLCKDGVIVYNVYTYIIYVCTYNVCVVLCAFVPVAVAVAIVIPWEDKGNSHA